MSDYSHQFVGRYPEPKGYGTIVADWRQCRDEAFVRALKPISPLLVRAKAQWRKAPDAARADIVAHFLTRAHPVWPFDFRRRRAKLFPSRNFFFGASVDREMARHALQYEFYDCNLTGNYHRLTPAVDWDRGKVSDLGSAGWLTLSFGYWGLFPAAGFAFTRDPRYAKVFAACWQRWFEQYPTLATAEALADHGDFNSLDPAAIDICMNVGRRALVLTDVLYSGLLGAVDAGLAFEVLKYQWFVSGLFQMAFEAHTPEACVRHGNHNLFDLGVVPVCLGLMYPEFPQAHLLVRRAKAVIRWHAAEPVQGAIRPDGTSWERSSRYGWYAAGMFRQAIEVGRLNDVRLLEPKLERRVMQFLDHFADLTAPDGLLIPYGDCQPPRAGCQLEPARALASGTACEAVGARFGMLPTLHAPARQVGAARAKLPPASRFFASSGLLVARSDWGRKASLLFVTAEPRAKTAGHSHDDFGAFQLWCNGVPLFLDAATWGYRIDQIIPSERGFYYSAFSHNMLTVEGYRPKETFQSMGNVRRWWGDWNLPAVTVERMELNGPRGEMTVSHQAYPGLLVRRRYRFDLAARWLEFEDRVVADVATRRVFRQWLHAGFGAQLRLAGPDALRVTLHGVQALCRWTASEPLKRVVERSPEVERAARVFEFGRPWRAYAERVTRSREFRISCRIDWENQQS